MADTNLGLSHDFIPLVAVCVVHVLTTAAERWHSLQIELQQAGVSVARWSGVPLEPNQSHVHIM